MRKMYLLSFLMMLSFFYASAQLDDGRDEPCEAEPIQFPNELPDSICVDADTLYYLGSLDESLEGELVTGTDNGYYIDASTAEAGTSTVVHYSAEDNCGETQTIETEIPLVNCDEPCEAEPIQFPNELPDSICVDADTLYYVGSPNQPIEGELVVGNSDGYFIDASGQVAGNSTVIHYSAQDDCGEMQTIRVEIPLVNCDEPCEAEPIQFPNELPDSICVDADTLYYVGSPNQPIEGELVVGNSDGYFIDASGQVAGNSTVIHYSAQDDCGEMQTIETEIPLVNCDEPCEAEPIQFPNELPDSICVDADTLYYVGSPNQPIEGELVVGNSDGYFIDASGQVAGNSTVIHYSAQDDCGEMQTIETEIPLVNCDEPCEAEPIQFPNELPDSICVDTDTIYTLGSPDIKGEIEGELVSSSDNGYYIDASGQEAGGSTLITYTAEDNCGEIQTIRVEILLVNCDEPCEAEPIQFPNELPDSICVDADTLYYVGSPNEPIEGELVVGNSDGYFIDASGQVAGNSTVIHYSAQDNCGETQTIETEIPLVNCEEPCEAEPIQFPNELPDSICVDADTLYYVGSPNQPIEGELVVGNSDGYFIDASGQVAGNSTVIHYSAQDNCGETQTIETEIPLVNCDEPCEAEPIQFPNELPDSICVDTDTIYTLGSPDIKGEIEGELVSSSDNGYYIDASGQEAGGSTLITYTAEDNCGEIQTIRVEIPLVNCDEPCEAEPIQFPNELPDSICVDTDTIYTLGSPDIKGEIEGELVSSSDNGYYIDASGQEAGGSTLITYTAEDNCGEIQTIRIEIPLVNCDEPCEAEPIQFPYDLPDSLCVDDEEPYFIVSHHDVVGEIEGEAVDSIHDGYILDATHLEPGTSTVITYTAEDRCGELQSIEIEIPVVECGPCEAEPIEFPNELPDSICVDTDTIYTLGSPDIKGEFEGELVSSSDNGFYIDASGSEAGTSTIVHYSAQDNCGEMQTIEVEIPLVNCDAPCEAEPIQFPNELPDSICVDTDTIYTLGSPDIRGEFEGELVSSSDNGFYIDASGSEAGTSTIVHYSAQDNCGEMQTIEVEIPLVNCDEPCVSEDIRFPYELPDSLCVDAEEPYFIDSHHNFVGELEGEAVHSNDDGYFLDATDLEPGTSTTIIYTAEDNCGKLQTLELMIDVVECGDTCSEVSIQGDIPDHLCLDDGPLFLASSNSQPFTSINIENEATGYFSGHTDGDVYLYPSEVGEGTAVIEYTALNDCEEEVTVTYTIEITDCDGQDCEPFSFNEALSDDICVDDDAISITSSDVSSYPSANTSGEGTDELTFNPSDAGVGTHIIVFTGINECGEEIEEEIEVTVVECEPTSINSGTTASSINLFPNPAAANANVTIEGVDVKHVEIYNMQNQKVIDAVGVNEVSASSLSGGLYIVRITLENGEQVTKRLMIK